MKKTFFLVIGHNLEHIQYVIDRSLKFANTVEDINFDMVYTIAAYHDIGHYIDAKNHEKVSADRNTLLETPLKRTYSYRIKHNPNYTLEDIIEESRQHIIKKFGKKGYASEKMYFEDLDYKKFFHDISELAEDKKKFTQKYMEVNRLNNKLKLAFDEI